MTHVLLLLVLGVAPQERSKQTPEIQKLCSQMKEKERRRTLRCKTEEEQLADEAEKRRKEIEEKEKPTHTSFAKWIHMDGMWTDGSIGSRRYGLAGGHVTVYEVGRMQIYGPPGFLLMTEPVSGGGRALKIVFTWGVDIHIANFTLPAANKKSGQLFLSFAKRLNGVSNRKGGNLDMIGLSITWDK